MKLTARQTALMLLKMHATYEVERDRSLSRFRIGRKTFRRLAGRTQVREAFVEYVKDELLDLMWVMFEAQDHFALLRLEKVDTWQRLATTRIREDLTEAQDDPDSYDFAALETQFRPAVDEDGTDD